MTEETLTVGEFARRAGRSPRRIRELIEAGELRAERFGRAGWHRIPTSELDRLRHPGDVGEPVKPAEAAEAAEKDPAEAAEAAEAAEKT